MTTRKREPGSQVNQLLKTGRLLLLSLSVLTESCALASNEVFLGSNSGFSLYMEKQPREGSQGSLVSFDEITKYRQPRDLQSMLPPFDRRFYQLTRKRLVIDCDHRLIGMLGMTWLGRNGVIIKTYQARHLELFPIPANSISEIELKHVCGPHKSGNSL